MRERQGMNAPRRNGSLPSYHKTGAHAMTASLVRKKTQGAARASPTALSGIALPTELAPGADMRRALLHRAVAALVILVRRDWVPAIRRGP